LKTVNNHTFVVCAYKESPYLEFCLRSLLKQTIKSQILITTSTPSEYIMSLAKKYKLTLRINTGEGGIVQDWNYGYRQAETKYVTIAHQDDEYGEHFTEKVLQNMNKAKNPLIAFTDYAEIRDEKIVRANTMLKIKRLMLLPLKWSLFHKSRFIRRRILSFGCPICCPSVTFHKENLPDTIFQVGYRSDEDWQAWEKLSKLKGEFVYCPEILTFHRIHEDSETTAIIGDNVRSKEDFEMFLKFWPTPIAKLLVRLYSSSEKSNNMENGW
jgi:glycosyltransferase involved in cell wall biosynthesis